MLKSIAASAPRRILAARLPLKTYAPKRLLNTAPPAQKSRTLKSSAARWALAIGGVYYYNTSPMFAEQPDEAIAHLDQSLHHIQDKRAQTLEAIAEQRKLRLAREEVQESQAAEVAQAVDEDVDGPGSVEDLEEEADQQGAFNPETGEINWDCPCLGGMAHGPCGEEFKAAFSCFVYSKEEPKGMECIDKFKGMQDCFRQHPEMYGSELEDDEDELEEELKAEGLPSGAEGSREAPVPAYDQQQSPQSNSPEDSVKTKVGSISVRSGDESEELAPKAPLDSTSKE